MPLSQHQATSLSAINILRYLGGFEIAALTGAYIYAAQKGLPVIIDGFIASAAALAATHIKPGCDRWYIYAHQSREQGHKAILDALNAEALINFNIYCRRSICNSFLISLVVCLLYDFIISDKIFSLLEAIK